jgi:membrane protease YdiL (CAAX protease family)
LAERVAVAALLTVQLAAVWWFLKGDLASWRVFQGLADTGSRQKRYWRWTVKPWIAFALPSLAGLLLLGRSEALTRMPPEFARAAAWLPHVAGEALRMMIASAGLGLVLGTAAVVVLTRLRRSDRPVGTIGDIGAILPRNRAELLPAALLSVTAGITEEVTFRLFVPLLLTLLTGSAMLAFAATALLFGVLHLYQGWPGVVATTVLGLVLSAVYLMAGLLWLPVLLHVLIDLNGLFVRPLLLGAWRRSGASP